MELKKRNLSKWDGRGKNINGVIDMEIKFGIHVIYLSTQKNVPCEAIDLALKVVKNNSAFDLAKLLLN